MSDPANTACSSCGWPVGDGALAVEREFDWPAGEPQCVSCMIEGYNCACLSYDEIDPDFALAIGAETRSSLARKLDAYAAWHGVDLDATIEPDYDTASGFKLRHAPIWPSTRASFTYCGLRDYYATLAWIDGKRS